MVFLLYAYATMHGQTHIKFTTLIFCAGIYKTTMYEIIKQKLLTWISTLRRCARSRKVAGSIPEDVIGIFH